MLDAAKDKLKEQSREVMKKHLPRILAGLDAVAAANKKKEGDKALSAEGKMENNAILGSGKAGFGTGGKGSLAGKDKKGNAITVEGKFGLKCWVDVTEVPLRKEVYEVSFHAVFEIEASFAGKLKQGSGFELSGGKELAISIKHEIEGEAKRDAYVDCVKAGKAGTQPELKLAAALDKAKVDDFKSLVAAIQSLGGQVGGLLAMADGDEQEIESNEKGGYGAGFAGKFGIEAGVTKMGSVTRTVRRSGKKWEFEYVAVDQETQSGGLSGQSGAGIGMGLKGSQAVQTFTRVVFEVQEGHPKLRERLEQVAAADSLEKLKALRAACSELKFNFTQGRSQGGSKQIDWTAGPAGMSLQDGQNRGHTETEDSDGNRVSTDSGSNERGGALNALGEALFGDKKKQDFHGAADQHNVGMGEVGDSTELFGLVDTLKAKGAKLLKDKVGIDTGAKGADTEKHLKGVELSDSDTASSPSSRRSPTTGTTSACTATTPRPTCCGRTCASVSPAASAPRSTPRWPTSRPPLATVCATSCAQRSAAAPASRKRSSSSSPRCWPATRTCTSASCASTRWRTSAKPATTSGCARSGTRPASRSPPSSTRFTRTARPSMTPASR